MVAEEKEEERKGVISIRLAFFFCTKLCFSFLILGICMHAFGGTLLCFCVASLFFKTINFNKTKHYCEKNKKQATIWDYLLYSSPA